MTAPTPEKRNSKDYITVTVLRKTHEEIVSYLQKAEVEYHTIHIGKFYDIAAMEKLGRLKDRNSLFNKFNSQTLISNGWEKSGSSYKRDGDTVRYNGVYWYHNDEKLTEDNYIDKIYDKSLVKSNPNIPVIQNKNKW